MYSTFERLLKEKGLSCYKVTQATGVTSATFTSWKQGKYTPKPAKLMKVAEFLDVPVSIFYEDDVADKQTGSASLNANDERDIASDLESILHKLNTGDEEGFASFDGTEIPKEDQEFFAAQLELMLRRLKMINKEKYDPHKKGK